LQPIAGMRARIAVPCLLALVCAASRPADAQHWPRQHPTLPLSETIPEALPAPPNPVEAGRGERPARNLRRDDGGYTHDATGFTARVYPDGRVELHDKSAVQGQLVLTPLYIAFAGTLDATDLVMRWLGEDPYQYQKAKFLEQTFEERAEMRRRYDLSTMDRALAELPDYLAAVWHQTGWPIELRRRVLFALWDECAEDGDGDGELVTRGGRHARFLIEQFIRTQLGPDSDRGYRPEELAELNRLRRSHHRFSPYRAPTPPERWRPAARQVAAAAPTAPRHSALTMRGQ
jgi:hypothetical protein